MWKCYPRHKATEFNKSPALGGGARGPGAGPHVLWVGQQQTPAIHQKSCWPVNKSENFKSMQQSAKAIVWHLTQGTVLLEGRPAELQQTQSPSGRGSQAPPAGARPPSSQQGQPSVQEETEKVFIHKGEQTPYPFKASKMFQATPPRVKVKTSKRATETTQVPCCKY